MERWVLSQDWINEWLDGKIQHAERDLEEAMSVPGGTIVALQAKAEVKTLWAIWEFVNDEENAFIPTTNEVE